MTYLKNIKDIILHFKKGHDYVVSSESDGRTKKLVYSIITDDLKQEISPFPQLNDSIQDLKTEEGNHHDGYFSYEVGNDGEPDKFVVITGLEANQREAEALRRPREISQRMQEIERRQKQIAQQMQEVRESGGSEVINTTSYIERRKEGDGVIEDISQTTNYSPPSDRSDSSSTRRGTNDNADNQEQCPLVVQPFPPRKK